MGNFDISPNVLSRSEILVFPSARCVWDGAPCSHKGFTKQVTDYGVCYTFNDDATRYHNTSKTGKASFVSLLYVIGFDISLQTHGSPFSIIL